LLTFFLVRTVTRMDATARRRSSCSASTCARHLRDGPVVLDRPHWLSRDDARAPDAAGMTIAPPSRNPSEPGRPPDLARRGGQGEAGAPGQQVLSQRGDRQPDAVLVGVVEGQVTQPGVFGGAERSSTRAYRSAVISLPLISPGLWDEPDLAPPSTSPEALAEVAELEALWRQSGGGRCAASD
jgi:hypothetical protein